jgi:hypothetical protein
MTDRPDPETAERMFRDMLTSHGFPQPDEVAHWRDAIVFGWHDTKAIVVVDLHEHGRCPEGHDGGQDEVGRFVRAG